MIKVDLNKLELYEFTAKDNPGQRCRAAFPLLKVHGAEESAMVYIELDPGEELGTHTDSAEETLLILEGSVEVFVGQEKTGASRGSFLLVPQMAPHNFRNTGKSIAKVLGFFGGANNIVPTFENVWLPSGSNVVDTSLMVSKINKV